MRSVGSHLLEDKMDDAVTHYINSHQGSESLHADASSLALNVQDDSSGRVVTVMQPLAFSHSQICRQVSANDQVGEGQWSEELLDPDGKLAAIVAHLSQTSRSTHHQHHKVPSVRNDVDASVILDTPMRMYNGGQHLEHQPEPIVVQVSQHLPPLPPLQNMKRCPETDWFSNKAKETSKVDNQILTDQEGSVLDIAASASPVQNKHQSKKSLPHKKRISKKLKKNTGNSTPQQDIVVIHCSSEVPNEEILPDNFVNSVSHPEHLTDETHHITHEVRPIFICQLCGEFYGEEQLKFYQHLKQHYEPHGTIMMENPVPDLGIDKMTNTCIVDNGATLPDSIVELSLENTVPKSMYQPMDKHIMYTSSDKTLSSHSNKTQYTMAGEKDLPNDHAKSDLYDTLAKLELFNCMKCGKTFRKQKLYEAHLKEVHSNPKMRLRLPQLEDIGEFSEPEDLMEGIHVVVEDGEQYEPGLLPHLTVENGHVHQEHVRQWYMRDGDEGEVCGCGAPDYCAMCVSEAAHPEGPLPAPAPLAASAHAHAPAPASAPAPPVHPLPEVPAPDEMRHSPLHLKEEELQSIFDADTDNHQGSSFGVTILPDQRPVEAKSEKSNLRKKKKPKKRFECVFCQRVFQHRNSLLYHILIHGEKQHTCKDCDKGFYTSTALKVHRRVHSGDKPYACDQCDRSFRQWSDLKYHKASLHSDKKNFKCEFCGKEFARRYSLNVHRRIHTGERNYKCEFCAKTFRASSYRLSHMRTHTGSKPYKCQQCDKCFRVAYDLRRHMLIHEKRSRAEEGKPKTKEKEKKCPQRDEAKQLLEEKPAKKGSRLPILRSILDKKQPQKARKVPLRKGAPNVTVASKDHQYKTEDEHPFDTEYERYSEVYKDDSESENGVLRPMTRAWQSEVSRKTPFHSEHSPDSVDHAHHTAIHGFHPNHGSYNNHAPHPSDHSLHPVNHNIHPTTHSHPITHSTHTDPNDSTFLERFNSFYNISCEVIK